MRAVAIVNGTLPRVRGSLGRALERAWPGRVRITDSLGHARDAIRDELARGVDLIAFGGGDGTVVMGLALLAEACRGWARPEPAIGALRLGASSAIARALGATDDPVADLARLVRGAGAWRPVAMIEALGLRAPFVSLGLAAQAVEGSRAIGRLVDRVPGARRLIGARAERVVSAAVRSFPRRAVGAPRIAVANAGAPAIALDPGGAERVVAAGQPLWAGPSAWITATTLAELGAGSTVARPDRFHLRCGDVGLVDRLRGAGPPRDFLCDRVEIAIEPGAQVAVGGELLGPLGELALAIARPVTMVALPANR